MYLFAAKRRFGYAPPLEKKCSATFFALVVAMSCSRCRKPGHYAPTCPLRAQECVRSRYTLRNASSANASSANAPSANASSANAPSANASSSKRKASFDNNEAQCPVCHDETMILPVICCKEGHSICKSCFDTLSVQSENNKCPICRAPLLNEAIRNSFLEASIAEIEVVCPNDYCNQRMCHRDVRNHLRKCHPCYLCTETDCKFHTTTFAEYQEHLMTVHLWDESFPIQRSYVLTGHKHYNRVIHGLELPLRSFYRHAWMLSKSQCQSLTDAKRYGWNILFWSGLVVKFFVQKDELYFQLIADESRIGSHYTMVFNISPHQEDVALTETHTSTFTSECMSGSFCLSKIHRTHFCLCTHFWSSRSGSFWSNRMQNKDISIHLTCDGASVNASDDNDSSNDFYNVSDENMTNTLEYAESPLLLRWMGSDNWEVDGIVD